MALQFRYLQRLREQQQQSEDEPRPPLRQQPTLRPASPAAPLTSSSRLHQPLPVAATTGKFKGRVTVASAPSPRAPRVRVAAAAPAAASVTSAAGADAFFSVLDEHKAGFSSSVAAAAAHDELLSATDLRIQQRASPGARRGPRERGGGGDAVDTSVASIKSSGSAGAGFSPAGRRPMVSPKAASPATRTPASPAVAAAARRQTPTKTAPPLSSSSSSPVTARRNGQRTTPRRHGDADFAAVSSPPPPLNADRMFFVVHNPLSEINKIKLGETREQRRQAGASPAGEQQHGRSAPDSPKPPVGGLYVPEQRQPHLHPRGGGFPIAAFITSSNGVVSPVRVATPPPQPQQAQPRSPHRATTPRASLDASRHASFDRNFYAHRGVGGAGAFSSSSSPSASSRSVSAAAANALRKLRRRQQSATFKSLVPRFAPLVAHGSGLTAPVIR